MINFLEPRLSSFKRGQWNQRVCWSLDSLVGLTIDFVERHNDLDKIFLFLYLLFNTSQHFQHHTIWFIYQKISLILIRVIGKAQINPWKSFLLNLNQLLFLQIGVLSVWIRLEFLAGIIPINFFFLWHCGLWHSFSVSLFQDVPTICSTRKDFFLYFF